MRRLALTILVILLVAAPMAAEAQSYTERFSRMLPAYAEYYELEGYTPIDAVFNMRGEVYLLAVVAGDDYKLIVPGEGEFSTGKLWNPRLDGKRALYNPCIRETDSWTNYGVIAGPGFIKIYAIVLGVKLPAGNIHDLWELRVEYDGIEAGFCKVVLTGAARDGSIWVAAFNAVNGSILFNATIDGVDPLDHAVASLPDGVLVADQEYLVILDDAGNVVMNETLAGGLGSPKGAVTPATGGYTAVLYQFGFVVVSLDDGRVFTHVFDEAPYHTYYVVEAAWNHHYWLPENPWYMLAILTRDSLYLFDAANWSLERIYYNTSLDNSGLFPTPRLVWIGTRTIAALLGSPDSEATVKAYRVGGGGAEEIALNPPPEELGKPAGIALKALTLLVFLGYYDPGSFTMKATGVAGYNMYTDPGRLVYHAALPRTYDGIIATRPGSNPIYMWDENLLVKYRCHWIKHLEPDDENEYFSREEPVATRYTEGPAFMILDEATLQYDGVKVNVTVRIYSSSMIREVGDTSVLIEGIALSVEIEVEEANGETAIITVNVSFNDSVIQRVYNGLVRGHGYIYDVVLEAPGAASITIVIPNVWTGNTTRALILLGPDPGYYEPPPAKKGYYEVNASLEVAATPPMPPVEETTTPPATTTPPHTSPTPATTTTTPTATETAATQEEAGETGTTTTTMERTGETAGAATTEPGGEAGTGAWTTIAVAAIAAIVVAAAYMLVRK